MKEYQAATTQEKVMRIICTASGNWTRNTSMREALRKLRGDIV